VSYYYTFSSQGAGPKSYNFTDPDGLSLLQAAVVAALKEVSPFTSATIQAFEQVLDQQQMPGVVDDPNVVEIGFSFNDVVGAGQTDLATLFEGNQTTLAVVAREVVEAITATGSTAISADLLYAGLSIYSSNGKRTNLGDPIVAGECHRLQQLVGSCLISSRSESTRFTQQHTAETGYTCPARLVFTYHGQLVHRLSVPVICLPYPTAGPGQAGPGLTQIAQHQQHA
jgi:hypothetical protein